MKSRPFLMNLSLTLVVLSLFAPALVGCGDGADTSPTAVTTPAPPPPVISSNDATASPTAVSPTMTPVPTATPAPTNAPPATATNEPTVVPEPSPSPEATPDPTAVPTSAPTATAVAAIVQPEWLAYLNQFRTIGNLPPLRNDDMLSQGSLLHSQYMVKNDKAVAHSELATDPFYDPAGDQAARNSNIFTTSQPDATYVWSMNFWISAPFHLVPILDPALAFVGFGSYSEAAGNVQMAAVLDVHSAPPAQPDTAYPVFFPADGSSTWVVRNSMFEWPDPLTSCPGFSRPTGAPIVLLLGDGSQQPRIFSHTLYTGDTEIETCLIHETNYRNPDSYAQSNGRSILDTRDAVVLIPQQPLAIDTTYTVQVVTDSNTYDWSFSTITSP